MLNAVRTKRSVYVVGSSRSRKTVALTVEVEAEEAAALSSNVHLGKYCAEYSVLSYFACQTYFFVLLSLLLCFKATPEHRRGSQLIGQC